MKKILVGLVVFAAILGIGYSKTINDSQVIPSDSSVYDDFLELQGLNKRLVFTNNTPLSVGELKFYLNQFDYDSMNSYSQELYDRIYDNLYEKEDITTIPGFELALHPTVNLEGYYKSNDDIPWSFNYFFHDNFISLPIDLGFGNNFAMGGNFFLGKSYFAAARNDSFWNIPLDKNHTELHKLCEFYFPSFAYAGFGKYNENWGFNVHIAKQGKTVGNTLTGSIIYNSTFETDGYVEFDVYSSAVKFTMDVVQVSSNRMDKIQQDNTERYLYLHQFDVRIFKNLKLSMLEGSLIAAPFSLRFLNPLPFMHQSGGWLSYISPENKEIYKETNFCADFAYMLEYIPVRNLRLYGIYNQIEMQLPWERGSSWGRYYPNSIGIQFGADYTLALENNARLLFALEGFYNSPYMYIKQTPSASLYRARLDMQTKDYVYSWIGSPYGPDSAGGMFSFEYDSNKKWKAGLDYTLVVKGQNDFNLLDLENPKLTEKDSDGNQYYDYYPSIKYKLREKGKVNDGMTNDEIYKEAINMSISGTKQISNQIKLKGTYFINPHFELNGQFVYNYIINNKHEKNKKDSGVELDLSVTYKIF